MNIRNKFGCECDPLSGPAMLCYIWRIMGANNYRDEIKLYNICNKSQGQTFQIESRASILVSLDLNYQKFLQNP